MRILVHIALLICLIWPAASLADSAPDPLNKGIRPHRRSSRVTMASERVDITLGVPLTKVTALFVFSNPTDTTETMEVGFPSSYPAEILSPLIHVDGNLVTPRISTEQTTEQFEYDSGVEEKRFATHWLLWDMSFKAGQTRRVTISYRVKPFDTADQVVTPYTEHRFAIEDEFKNFGWEMTPEVRLVLDAIDSRTTGYVLRTGAGWGGPIGKAVITAGPVDLIRWVRPLKSTSRTTDKQEWKFADFEPDSDIFVEFNLALPLAKEQALADAACARHTKSHALWEYRTFLTPVPDRTRRQFDTLAAAFPEGTKTTFTEHADIFGQQRQEHMKAVLDHRPDLMAWLPEAMRDVLFDGDPANGEGVNYKLLRDGRAYIVMRIDRPRLPDGRKAELWEYEYLFFGHLPLTRAHADTMSQALAWKNEE